MKRRTIAILIGASAIVGVEVYGFYSMRRSVESRLIQIETELESLRAAQAARTSQIAAEAPGKEPSSPKTTSTQSKGLRAIRWNERIARDRKLAAKLQKMLPAGTNIKDASSGFKNEKEFISAVHVSKNLGIPFARLKAKVTGNHAVPMETAIHDLRADLPKAKAKAEARKGEQQATETLKQG